MNKPRSRRLPGGGTTTDVEVYAAAWSKLGDATARALGMGARLHSFDPDIVLDIPLKGGLVYLPVAVARRIAELGGLAEGLMP